MDERVLWLVSATWLPLSRLHRQPVAIVALNNLSSTEYPLSIHTEEERNNIYKTRKLMEVAIFFSNVLSVSRFLSSSVSSDAVERSCVTMIEHLHGT